MIADCLARVTSMREVWLDDITAHYPPTLAVWRERFFAAWDGCATRLRRALPAALGLLPELLRGGLPRAADRRRAGALRETGVAVRKGRGEPLLPIHGLGGSARIWTPVIDRLARAPDTIALDMPGAKRIGCSPLAPRSTMLLRVLAFIRGRRFWLAGE